MEEYFLNYHSSDENVVELCLYYESVLRDENVWVTRTTSAAQE